MLSWIFASDAGVRMQYIRTEACEARLNATYQSALPILTGAKPALWQSSLEAHSAGQADANGLLPLPDSCALFARKIEPDAANVQGFFEDCALAGLPARCILEQDGEQYGQVASSTGAEQHKVAAHTTNSIVFGAEQRVRPQVRARPLAGTGAQPAGGQGQMGTLPMLMVASLLLLACLSLLAARRRQRRRKRAA